MGDTAALEARVETGECAYVERVCVQESEARTMGSYQVYRPCWKENYTYACCPLSQNTCNPWREKGCLQVGSQCIQKQDNRCLLYEQKFECTVNHQGVSEASLSGEGVPYCLDGNCNKTCAAADANFAYVMSKLAVFKEMALDKDPVNLSIFNGRDLRCSRNIASFRDCCGGCSGWGVSLGLSHCSEKEKLLFNEHLGGNVSTLANFEPKRC